MQATVAEGLADVEAPPVRACECPGCVPWRLPTWADLQSMPLGCRYFGEITPAPTWGTGNPRSVQW